MEELVFEALGLLEEGSSADLDAFLGAHPRDAGEVRRRLAMLESAGLVHGDEGAASPIDAADMPEVVGSYTLEEPLGEGGMGIVFAAHDATLDRRVAVKIVRPRGSAGDEARARFEREVRVVAGLDHPSIVRIFDVGETSATPWFAMELLEGATLSQVIGALASTYPANLRGASLAQVLDELTPRALAAPPAGRAAWHGTWHETCARIARDVAEALHHAHQAGVVHRDVKPSNVSVTPHGRVVLLDFGLAQLEGEAELTRTGAMVGSLPYTPPERARADDAAAEAGDVYGVGVLLYELLTLELPFRATSRSALVAEISRGRPDPLEARNDAVPAGLRAVVARAMHRDPQRRHRSAADLAADLDDVLAGRPPSAPGRGPFELLDHWRRARPLEAAAAAAVALVLLVILPWTLRARADAAERAASHEQRAFDHVRATLEAADELQNAVLSQPAVVTGGDGRQLREVLQEIQRLRSPMIEPDARAAAPGPLRGDIARALVSEAEASFAQSTSAASIQDLLDRALELEPNPPARLALRIALVRRRIAQSPEERDEIESSLDALTSPGDPWIEIRLRSLKARWAVDPSAEQYRTAVDGLRRAVETGSTPMPDRSRLDAILLEAWASALDHDDSRLQPLLGDLDNLALTSDELLLERRVRVEVLDALAACARARGESSVAARHLKDALTIRRQLAAAFPRTALFAEELREAERHHSEAAR